MEIILPICAIVLVVLFVVAALSAKVRNTVISSSTYKKAFAVHMNLFSRIHNRAVKKRKEEMFNHMKMALKGVQGDILEIGAGTGANFEFLPEGCSVIALEPNPHMETYLVENAKRFPHVQLKEIVSGYAENMEGIADNSVEAVLCTLTLCSVTDMEAVLSEIKRVLKPITLKHGGIHSNALSTTSGNISATDAPVAVKLRPIWKTLGFLASAIKSST